MKKALSIACVLLLAACAGAPAFVVPKQEPVWRYAVRTAADGSRKAVAVDMNSADEIPLPDGLWCPHGALIELQRDEAGKVVGAVSKAEQLDVEADPNGLYVGDWDGSTKTSICYRGTGTFSGTGTSVTSVPEVRPFVASSVPRISGKKQIFPALPAFAIAPAQAQKQPFVVLRWQPAKDQTDWAILERHADNLRVTRMGPWQIEHLQFQRMERPGPGLENAVLLTFQAGEGSQHAVVKVEIGENGARLRPMTAGDAAMIKGFMGRAMEGEKGVLGRVVGE